MLKVVEISPYDVELPQRAIAARMGFKGVGAVPEQFRAVYNEVMDIALKVARPAIAFDNFIPTFEDAIKIDDVKIDGNLANNQLGKSIEITAMLSTLGDEIDDEISKLHVKGEELKSFMLDSIGSELIEYTSRKFDLQLRTQKQMKGSARIAPGYVDLSISLNAWFASIFGRALNVSCDAEVFTFLPRKTISAFIGWSR